MSTVLQFFAFLALGAGFSIALLLLSRLALGKITRFAVDFALCLSLCLAFYAINFLFNYGQLVQHSFFGVIVGLIAPRLFVKIKP